MWKSVERINGTANVFVRQRFEVAAAWAWRVHPEHAGGDGIVGTTMRDGSLHSDDGELRGLDALAAPLAEIEAVAVRKS